MIDPNAVRKNSLDCATRELAWWPCTLDKGEAPPPIAFGSANYSIVTLTLCACKVEGNARLRCVCACLFLDAMRFISSAHLSPKHPLHKSCMATASQHIRRRQLWSRSGGALQRSHPLPTRHHKDSITLCIVSRRCLRRAVIALLRHGSREA